MNNQLTKIDRYVLLASITIFIALHFHQLNAPPNGYHQWRESDTAAIILNYYQEDANFLHQRCNQRGAGSGITGGELPTYAYTSAATYYLFGPHHLLPRLTTLAGALVALFLFWHIVRLLGNEKKATYSTIALAWSPLFLFYSFKIMPDVWMLMFMLGAVYYFLKSVEMHSIAHLAISAVALILSATTKPLSLCLYLPFIVYLTSKSDHRIRTLLTMSAYISLTFVAVLSWYLYGLHLNSVHNSEAFYMGNLISISHVFLMKAQFYKKLFLQWPFELWIGWALLPVFAYGLMKIYKARQSHFYFIWILSCYIVFAIVAAHAGSHDYYTLVIVPPLAAICGWGMSELAAKPKLKTLLIVFLLIVVPAVSFIRIESRFADVEEFGVIRNAADQHISRNSLVIVDETTSAIRLYQLNRHGWAFRDELTESKIQPLINAGGEYLILRLPIDSANNDLRQLVKDSVIHIGPLFAYKTIKPN